MIPLEKTIQSKILKYLKTLKNCKCFKVAQGMYSERGISDIVCCCNGRFIAIEVKRPKLGRLTANQRVFLDSINDAGGVGIIATSVDEVKKLFEEVL